MTATETLDSLDRTLAEVRRNHATETKALSDQLLAAQIETSLLRKAIAEANDKRDWYLGIATKLITQFSTVSAVFDEAVALALEFKQENSRSDGTASVADALGQTAGQVTLQQIGEKTHV